MYEYREGDYRSYPNNEEIVGRMAVPTIGGYRNQQGIVALNPMRNHPYISYAGSGHRQGVLAKKVVSSTNFIPYIIEYRDPVGRLQCAIGLERRHIYAIGDERTYPNTVNPLPLLFGSETLKDRRHIIPSGTKRIRIHYSFNGVTSSLAARWIDIDDPSGKVSVGQLMHPTVRSQGTGSFTVEYSPELHPNGLSIDLTTNNGARYDLGATWSYSVQTFYN